MLRKFGNALVFFVLLAAIGVLVWIFVEGSKCAFKKAKEFCTEKRNEWREEQERRNMAETSLKRIYEDTLGLKVAYNEWEEAVNLGKSEDIVKNHMRFMAVVENSKYFSNDGQFMVEALKQNIERKEAYVKHGMTSF